MTGGGPVAAPLAVYDLATPDLPPLADASTRAPILVAQPTALVALQTQRLLGRSPSGEITRLGDVQWSDSLPQLLQAKIIQILENLNVPATAGDPSAGAATSRQLQLNLRNFEIAATPAPVADVAFSATMVAKDGHVLGTRVFHAKVPSKSIHDADAVAALDAAFGKAAAELVAWISGLS